MEEISVPAKKLKNTKRIKKSKTTEKKKCKRGSKEIAKILTADLEIRMEIINRYFNI